MRGFRILMDVLPARCGVQVEPDHPIEDGDPPPRAIRARAFREEGGESVWLGPWSGWYEVAADGVVALRWHDLVMRGGDVADPSTLHYFRDEAGEWRWHVKAPNGEVVADSGEGYRHRTDAEREAVKLFEDTVIYVWDALDDSDG